MNLSKELMKLVHDGVIFKRLGGEITRKELMDQLYITEEMVTNKSQAVIEKLFCVAVLNQGADIASKILEEYSKMVKCLEGE